jgi:hypothetical protein
MAKASVSGASAVIPMAGTFLARTKLGYTRSQAIPMHRATVLAGATAYLSVSCACDLEFCLGHVCRLLRCLFLARPFPAHLLGLSS